MQHSTRNAADPVSERRHAIHEDPESRESIRRLHDSVEDKGHGKESSCDTTSRLRIRESRDEEMCEGRSENEELDGEE